MTAMPHCLSQYAAGNERCDRFDAHLIPPDAHAQRRRAISITSPTVSARPSLDGV